MVKARLARGSGVLLLIILREQRPRVDRGACCHEVVTHVLGTTCYLCLRAGQAERLIVCGDRAAKFAGHRSSLALLQEALLGKKALPEPDLKYRSSLRAVASSAIATSERRIAGKYLLVETTWPC